MVDYFQCSKLSQVKYLKGLLRAVKHQCSIFFYNASIAKVWWLEEVTFVYLIVYPTWGPHMGASHAGGGEGGGGGGGPSHGGLTWGPHMVALN